MGCPFIRPIGEKDGQPAVIFTSQEMKALTDDVKFTLIGKFQFGHPKMDSVREFFEDLKLIGEWKLGLLDGRHLLIRLRKEEDYARIFAQQSLLVAGTPMKIIKWTPDFDPAKEPPIVPMWFKFPGLPFQLYHRHALYNISQALGTPLRIDSPTFDRVSPGGPRVQVERDITLPDVAKIWITDDDDGFWQKVVVENKPLYCQHCKMVGHIRDTCYRLHPPSRKKVSGPSQQRVDATLVQQKRVASDADNGCNTVDEAVGETPQQVAHIAIPVASRLTKTVVSAQAGSVAPPPVVQTAQVTSIAVESDRYIQKFSRKRRNPPVIPIAAPTVMNQQDQSTDEEEAEEGEVAEEEDEEDWQVYTSRRKKKPGDTLLIDDTLVTTGTGVALKRLLYGSPRNRARVPSRSRS